MSSLSGAIMRSLEKGTPPQMMSLFIVNILNLLFIINPYEGASASANALKRSTYSHNPDILNTQAIALVLTSSIQKYNHATFQNKRQDILRIQWTKNIPRRPKNKY
ncbi:hypothetical protein [Escherichia coli]|uniref:hypothetical protein n=1 Tax=Escherichia coli TaxID=562 RepID=UPI00397C4C05